MHPIYTTPGFIVGSRPSGEAGKLISVFTRDLGLVFASAQGIRFEKSKLRPFTQDYSFGSFSFVRGKEYWRMTGASEEVLSSTYNPNIDNPNLRMIRPVGDSAESNTTNGVPALVARIASLLERLLHGEEAHPELFDCVQGVAKFLAGTISHGSVVECLATECLAVKGLNEEEFQTLESLVVIRILNKLGYVGDVAELNSHIQSSELSLGLLDDLKTKRTVMNRHINKALKESHL